MLQVMLLSLQLIAQNNVGLQQVFGHNDQVQGNDSVPKVSELFLDHEF